MIMAPIKSGTQPPWNTLSRLAPRKVRSINRNGTINAAAAQSGHFQYFHTTIKREDRCHHHRAGDGDAVGGGERA